jgi:acetolactate synthase-1/2/3 large subunit
MTTRNAEALISVVLQAMAGRPNRGITNTDIGTTLEDPNVDYAAVAKGFGVHARVDQRAAALAPALRRAAAAVWPLLTAASEPR